MSNKLIDLNDALFSQLENLAKKDLTGEALNDEIERTKAMTSISREIIDNAALALKAAEFKHNHKFIKDATPKMLEN